MREQRAGPWGQRAVGPALASRGRARRPDLARAAVALFALLHKAVSAVRGGHREPGVGRVRQARSAPLAEEGAQLSAAAGAEHSRERVPTRGKGRRTRGDAPSPPTVHL